MCSDRSTALKRQWVSPFGYPRIKAWSAAPRGLSQPPTSFIGFRRQGIHRWLFVAWRTKMLVLALEFSRGKTAHAWAGHHRRTKQRPARTPPDRGTHGVSGPPAQRAGSEPGLEEPKGSTRKAWRTNPPTETP